MVKNFEKLDQEGSQNKLIRKIKTLKKKLTAEKEKRSATNAKWKALIIAKEDNVSRFFKFIENSGFSKIKNHEEDIKILKKRVEKQKKVKKKSENTLFISEELENINNRLQSNVKIEEKLNKELNTSFYNPLETYAKEKSLERINNAKVYWLNLTSFSSIKCFNDILYLYGCNLININLVLDLIRNWNWDISDIDSWIKSKVWIHRPETITFYEAKIKSKEMSEAYNSDWNLTFINVLTDTAISLEECRYKWGALINFMNIESCTLTITWNPGYPWFIRSIILHDNNLWSKNQLLQKLNENYIEYYEEYELEILHIILRNEFSVVNLYLNINGIFELVDENIENATNLWNSIQNIKKELLT